MNRSIFQLWQPHIKNSETSLKKIKTMNINFGPQHPAAHGVLRLITQLNGEIVEKTDIHIGLLRRGTEKLIEDRFYNQSIPYFDRLDYVSMVVQEHAYCLAIEQLLQTTNFSNIFTYIRTLFDELTRILNHMLAIACHALDVGSMSSVFWAFEEREKIMEFYERVSGARMHAAFYRPNEMSLNGFTPMLIEDITEFTKNCFVTLNEMHNVLTFNKIWKQRLVNIGVISLKDCINFGLTGVMSRSTGIKRDLWISLKETYSNYYYLNLRSYIGLHGDSYDRYLIRMNEMCESLNIINQCIQKLNKNSKNTISNANKIKNKIKINNLIEYLNKNEQNIFSQKNEYNSMESLILYFKNWSEGQKIKKNLCYQSVESPKGEFGVTLFANNTNKPYKCKIRSPAYHHLQVLPILAKGHFLADLVTLIGTVDIVFGEIDR